jgi:hypothetical protein
MARSFRALSLLLFGMALARSAQAVAPTVTIGVLTDGSLVKLTTNVAGTFTGTLPVTVKLRVDAGAEVDTSVVNNGYIGSVTLPTAGPHTITATATNTDGSASTSVNVIGDGPPVVQLTAPAKGFTTGDVTVNVVATVTDLDPAFDPNDPNTLFVNGAQILFDPNTGTFHGKAPVTVGSHALVIRARDPLGNVSTLPDDIFGTRTVVCENPPVPQTTNTDSTQPFLIVVDRLDDRLLPAGFDPNANPSVECDIRPDLHPDTGEPNDPNNFNPPFARCPLRGALQLANAHPGIDVIRLPAGTIKLTRRGEGDLRGDLDVTDDLVIIGQGRDVSLIDARKLKDRVFDVAPGVSLRLIQMTMRGGQTPKKTTESGGCIRVTGPRHTGLVDPNDPNNASLASNNVALLDCKSGADGGGIALELQSPDDFSKITCGIVARASAKKDGGGMLVDGGALQLRNSTIAFSSSGGIGGALANRDASLVMTNATISTNKAKVSGGGLALANGASATLNNVTFAKNKAKRGMSVSTSSESGGANELDVSNSILGDKPKAACDVTGTSPLVSHGGNLDPGVSCDLTESSDLENSDPRLDKLATNIGIPTHALRSDSPAIDHGVFATCEPLDERNADRVDGPPVDSPGPDDDVCGSGSFEFASEAPPETPAPAK